jgi:hypothetical protein
MGMIASSKPAASKASGLKPSLYIGLRRKWRNLYPCERTNPSGSEIPVGLTINATAAGQELSGKKKGIRIRPHLSLTTHCHVATEQNPERINSIIRNTYKVMRISHL